jgi:predicted MFS family arabinose efflux permease
MTTLPMTIARAVGPALGALLVTRAGPVAAFATAGAFHLIYLSTLTRLRPRPRATDAPHGDDLLAGWRFARATPGVVALLLAIATIGVGVDPIITLTPSLVETLGRPATLVGSIASVFGLGAAAGMVLLRSMRGRLGLARVGTVGLIALTASMVGLAVATGPVSALTAATLGGVGMTLSLTTFTTLLQQGVPDGVRGRVMALWSIAFLGSRPVTAGLLGAIADVVSIRTSLLAAAVAIACGAYASRPSRTSLTVGATAPATLTP